MGANSAGTATIPRGETALALFEKGQIEEAGRSASSMNTRLEIIGNNVFQHESELSFNKYLYLFDSPGDLRSIPLLWLFMASPAGFMNGYLDII